MIIVVEVVNKMERVRILDNPRKPAANPTKIHATSEGMK